MVRTPCCDKTGLKKGTWTPEEDKKLIAYVTKYGYRNWRQLPKFAGLARCGKSCRLRWMNYLRPNIKRGNFSKEEEEMIIRLHKSLGNRWSAIAAKLPGRTDNEIKNHWHSSLKKSMKQNSFTRNEAKEASNDKTKQDGESKANIKSQEQKSKIHDTPPIFESSLSSTQPTSSSDLISSMATELILDNNNEVQHFEPYEEPSGNFWTEPFVADNFYISNDFQVPLPGPGYSSVYSPFLDGEIILWP